MRRPRALLWLLFVLPWPALAQTEIHRCIGANGNPVFTDQPCAALQATPVNPTAPADDRFTLQAAPPILCAADLDALRQGVIDAFAARDPNRLAGLTLWNGYGRRAAIVDIRELARLMKHPLLGVDMPGESSDPAPAEGLELADPFTAQAMAAAPPVNDQLVLHIADNDGSGNPRELRYDVVRRAGCLWLQNGY